MMFLRFPATWLALLLSCPLLAVSQADPTVVANGEKLYAPAYRYQNVKTLQLDVSPASDVSCLFPGENEQAFACNRALVHFGHSTKGTTYLDKIAHYNVTDSYGFAGWTLGNGSGWSSQKNTSVHCNWAVVGIHQCYNLNQQTHATGDNGLIYGYSFSDGGASAMSDEGTTLVTVRGGETNGYFHGTVTAGAGLGALTPTLGFTSGNAWTTDGAFLIDITKGTLKGHITSYSVALPTPYGPWINSLGTDANLPLTTAYGNIVPAVGATYAIPNPGTTADAPVLTTLSVQLGQIAGVAHPLTAGSVVCVASSGDNSVGGGQPEQAKISSVSTPSGGLQTIKILLRNPAVHASIWQGGICGQYISFDANLAATGYRTTYYAFGSLTGSDLIYGNNILGVLGQRPIPDETGSELAQVGGMRYSGFHLYPGAQIVRNNTAAYAPTLEANSVAWTVGDVVENPHHPVQGGNGLVVDYAQRSPTSSYFGASSVMVISRGLGVSGRFRIFDIFGDQDQSQYRAGGGRLSAPFLFYVHDQVYSDAITLDRGPQVSARGNNALINVTATAEGRNNAFNLFHLPKNNNASTSDVTYNPGTGVTTFDGLAIRSLRAKTGTRFLCIDTNGVISSSTTPCSGT